MSSTSTAPAPSGRPSLQLFPPASRARSPTDKSPVDLVKEQNWPQRTTSRKTPVKVTVSIPEPVVERKANGKSPVDFHEFVIRVDSPIKSPVPAMLLPTVEAPKRAHIPAPRTPPTETGPRLPTLPPRSRSVSPIVAAQSFRSQSSPAPVDTDVRPGTAISTSGNTAVSPDLSNVVSPVSTITSPLSQTISPSSHMPSPPRNPYKQRAASPAFSGMDSPRSGSPTLVRSNSAATAQHPSSPAPAMRSMFPQYNPNVPLGHQSYLPTQASPTHIPMDKISRPMYSPTHYTPYGSLGHNRSESATSAVPTPYYTPATMLDSLWDATNGQGTPMVQTFTLQMHRHAAAQGQSNQPQISFGPTKSLPFYSLCHTDLPNPDGQYDDEDDVEHELLIRRHHPTKPTNVPITHLTLNANQSPATVNESAEFSSVVTTIYPKLAAMTALDIASHSPAASHIAAFDPDASSPAAQRLAEDVLRGTAERECCALVWSKSPAHLPTTYSATASGTYALHHPVLGVFPITHEGDTSPGLTPVLGSLPFSTSSPSRQGNHKPTVISVLNPFATPATSSSSSFDDSVLAKLDFSADSLVLNVAALLKMGNTYFIDVVVSSLLAVALAEERRLRRAMQFDAPPTYPYPPPPRTPRLGSSAASTHSSRQPSAKKQDEAKDKRRKLFSFMRGSGSSKDVATSLERDIEMAPWKEFAAPTPAAKAKKSKKGAKTDKEEDDLPGLTRGILTVLTFFFKTAVWVLGMAIKVIAGVVVKVSTWVVTKA